jgi:hypothetical protein
LRILVDGDFERVFAEKPRILMRYPGGMSPVDLAMLPLIIERLQDEHPNCALHIRSVQDEGIGATVTISIDNRIGLQDDGFKEEVLVLQAKLEAVLDERDHLRKRLELVFSEAISVIRDIAKRPNQEIHVHRPKGLVTIEGTSMTRDTYNMNGQAGAVGSNAHAHDMTFQQLWSQGSLDLPRLAEELAKLRDAMRRETEGTREQDKAVAAVAEAEEAAVQGDGLAVLRHLKAAGKWTLGIAEKIGVAVAVEAIKKAM